MLSMAQETGTEEEKRVVAADILHRLDLEDLAEVHPMALSGGQKQRCAIAAGIASGKPIMIFDEPTSGLDIVHMRQVAEEIRELRRAGKTIFIVTHDYEFILTCCTHILHMEDGKVVEQYDLCDESAPRLRRFFHIAE